jgi:hypothetical protein
MTAMTTVPENLLAALQTADMLEIDGLHAFEFSLTEEQLNIESMDGRERKVWRFSPAQIEAASFDDALQSWVINDGNADHRIIAMSAFAARDEEDEEQE